MQRLVRWLGASEANMQMGHMRFEPNVNLHITRDGQTYKTPIVEVKNLNSFRALERTVLFEIDRQYDQWLTDPAGYSITKLAKQNRGYDDNTGTTVFQREKEEAHDYRYLPDPDLMPVKVSDKLRDDIKATIGELPLARKKRFIDEYNLTDKEADALTMNGPTGDLLDAVIAAGGDAKRCVNLLLGRAAAIANEKGCTIAEVGIAAGPLAELVKMADSGKVNATAAAKIFDKMVETGQSPGEIAESEGLLAVTDTGQLETWVDEAIAANPEAVADATEGGKKQKRAFGFLMGQVMQKSRGAAEPGQVQKLLSAKLGK